MPTDPESGRANRSRGDMVEKECRQKKNAPYRDRTDDRWLIRPELIPTELREQIT